MKMGIKAGGPNVNKFSMNLLGWKEITTKRQEKNGTRIFQLPIKKYNQFIEVGSFESGYVRRMNGGYTPYQLNKCEPSVEYYKDYKWCDTRDERYFTGKYNKYIGKKRILIPNEVDRLEYLIAYCLKNYYIKNANQVAEGSYVSKWYHEYQMEKHEKTAATYQQIIDEMNDKHRDICEYTWSGGQITDSETGEIYVHEQHAYWNKIPNSVQVIVDGHRYNVK